MSFPDILKFIPREATAPFCPAAVRETVPVQSTATAWQRFRRYCGLGLFVSVGYMDPGNWATDIEAGSRFGYRLLSVVVASCIAAMYLQALCVRVGVASGKDLAQLCGKYFSRRVRIFLWIAAEIAIIACDFAEVLGTALALKLLFGISLSTGVLLTCIDTVIVLMFQRRAFFGLEGVMVGLVGIIAAVFAIELHFRPPDWTDVARSLVTVRPGDWGREGWLVAIGIIGATVMPHNLYLHSSIVGTRKLGSGDAARSDAIRLLSYDTVFSLLLAMFVNAAILLMAGAVFHASGHGDVAEIDDAYDLLAPLLGTSLAATFFAVALFASGQSSTFTGTIAGQVILDGFMKIRIPCWQRRLITRALAIAPAWIGIQAMGEDGLGRMLVLSQVVLSLQLPFAVFPLVMFAGRKDIMGGFALPRWQRGLGYLLGAGLMAANAYLLMQMVRG